MSTVITANGSVVTGSWKIDDEHVVSYETVNVTGFFATHSHSRTVYTCSCGRKTANSLRAQKKTLNGHDAWKTQAQSDAARARLIANAKASN